jgi:hypothetical protein
MAAAEKYPEYALVSPAFYTYATPEDVKKAVNGRSLKGFSKPINWYGMVMRFTPLSVATWGQPDPDILRVLLDAGCEADGQLAEDYSRREKKSPEIFAMLLRATPRFSDLCYVVRTLAYKGEVDYLRLVFELAEPRPDPDCRYESGSWTPLMEAAQGGSPETPETVRFLLSVGADPSLTDSGGHTAEDRAAISSKLTNEAKEAVLKELRAATSAPGASSTSKKP